MQKRFWIVLITCLFTISLASASWAQEPTDAQRFFSAFSEMETEKGPMLTWSLEDKYLLQQMMDEIGMVLDGVKFGMPGADDFDPDKAVIIALVVLRERVQLDEEVYEALVPQVIFNVVNPDRPVYQILYELPPENENEASRNVSITLDGRTGEPITEALALAVESFG